LMSSVVSKSSNCFVDFSDVMNSTMLS
jgi:hypothetical protein